MKTIRFLPAFVAIAIVASLSASQIAFAANGPNKLSSHVRPHPSLTVGTITAIDGNTITISVSKTSDPRSRSKNSSAKNSTVATNTLTVDAGSSKIRVGKVRGTMNSIKVGDTVSVIGTDNGGTIKAKSILDRGVR